MLKLLLYCLKRIDSFFKDTKKLFLKTKIWKQIILPNWKDDFFNCGVLLIPRIATLKNISTIHNQKLVALLEPMKMG